MEKNDPELHLGHAVAPRFDKNPGNMPQDADRELTKAKPPVDKPESRTLERNQ
jgi:hypothetical protein